MNDNDELNDSAVLSAVRDSMSGLRMPTAPRLDTITARGRARRRRLGGLSVAAAGACAGLVAAASLAGASGGAAPVATAGRALQHQTTQARLAAFSVVADPSGATTLTLYPGQTINPGAVRQALADHGIPAIVTAGQFCRTAIQPPPGVGDVVVMSPRPEQVVTSESPLAGRGPTLTIYGSRIPSGVKLSIGYRQDPQNREISFTLIVAGAPLTCTSIPDNGPHGND
jgi:hypothetical protein